MQTAIFNLSLDLVGCAILKAKYMGCAPPGKMCRFSSSRIKGGEPGIQVGEISIAETYIELIPFLPGIGFAVGRPADLPDCATRIVFWPQVALDRSISGRSSGGRGRSSR